MNGFRAATTKKFWYTDSSGVTGFVNNSNTYRSIFYADLISLKPSMIPHTCKQVVFPYMWWTVYPNITLKIICKHFSGIVANFAGFKHKHTINILFKTTLITLHEMFVITASITVKISPLKFQIKVCRQYTNQSHWQVTWRVHEVTYAIIIYTTDNSICWTMLCTIKMQYICTVWCLIVPNISFAQCSYNILLLLCMYASQKC